MGQELELEVVHFQTDDESEDKSGNNGDQSCKNRRFSFYDRI